MSETIKHMVPRVRWTKWTGDNLTELQDYWVDELAAYGESGVTLSKDENTGELVADLDGFFGAFATRIQPGTWFSVPGMRISEDELFRQYIEVPDTGLMP